MEKDNKNKEKGDMGEVYEVSYLLLPSLALEQVPARADSLKEEIVKAGGAVISFENPILIDLAYPMIKVVQTTRHKCQSGYFGWVKFDLSHDGIEAVKKIFDTAPDILRHLIVKTVRENTLISGKMMLRKDEMVKREEDGGADDVVAPEEATSPEEIDKSIDDLVIA